MDADDTVSDVNDRFEDAVGFRFHEDVRTTIIFEQLVKEHGRAKVLRALTGSWRNFQIRSKPRLLSTNSRLTLIVIRSEFSRPAGSFHFSYQASKHGRFPTPQGVPFCIVKRNESITGFRIRRTWSRR